MAHEALEQFFSENKIEHTIEDLGDFKLFKVIQLNFKSSFNFINIDDYNYTL